jgi:hypothetical protein
VSELGAQSHERAPLIFGRDWDTRVVWLEQRQCWWWNAWRARTATELHGFADSQEEASQAMYQAIERAGPSPALGQPRPDKLGGAPS